MASVSQARNAAAGRRVGGSARRWTGLASLLALALALAPSGARASEAAKVKALPDQWRVWLEEEVYPLISSAERKAFLALETDAQRQEFAERMWSIWGAQLGQGSAFRRNYEERLQMCRTDFGNTTEDRARVLLLHGPPDARQKVDCDEVFVPLEFWVWSYLEGLGQNVTVVFYQPYGLGRFRLWDPFETVLALYSTQGRMALGQTSPMQGRPEDRCSDGQQIMRLISMAQYWMDDIRVKEAMQHVEAPTGAAAGVESATTRFMQFTTLLPKGATPLDFAVASKVSGRDGSHMRVAFSTTLARSDLGSAKVGDVDVVQVDVTGEISHEGGMVDTFRYAFTFPAASKELPIVVERDLRPGKYHLRMKVQDSHSNHAGVKDLDFEVLPPVIAPDTAAQQAAAATVALIASSKLPALSLQAPEGEGISGLQRFTALTGPGVERVEFLLDGKSVLTKNRPPFEVDLDLGPFPRLATVTAIAYDAKGQEIDRKQASLNVGRERFLVRLQPISAADRAGSKVHAVAKVNVPPDRKLAKVELFWNETPLQTLYQPPFDTWLTVQNTNEIGYLRALAVLDDGSQAEDVQFVNAPEFLGGVRVETVELPVTVLGKDDKPVEGLQQADFEVAEDGVPQNISHFSLQQELPIRLGIVVDTSGSMEKTLPDVQRVVLGFLHNLLQPRDRAFIEAFSDRPELLETFTADFGALERALIALKADRETALYDAVVYGLFQFSGVRGRKAMILLTDGEDNASRMDFDRTLDYAQRSGVTIYCIGIDLPITKLKYRSELSRLARVTGGEAFFLPRDSDLKPVYGRIDRELRTQYLLAYTSNAESPGDAFRKITVKVKRSGVDVRTIAGYYPGG